MATATVVETPTGAPTRHYLIGLWLFMASESMIFLHFVDIVWVFFYPALYLIG